MAVRLSGIGCHSFTGARSASPRSPNGVWWWRSLRNLRCPREDSPLVPAPISCIPRPSRRRPRTPAPCSSCPMSRPSVPSFRGRSVWGLLGWLPLRFGLDGNLDVLLLAGTHWWACRQSVSLDDAEWSLEDSLAGSKISVGKCLAPEHVNSLGVLGGQGVAWSLPSRRLPTRHHSLSPFQLGSELSFPWIDWTGSRWCCSTPWSCCAGSSPLGSTAESDASPVLTPAPVVDWLMSWKTACKTAGEGWLTLPPKGIGVLPTHLDASAWSLRGSLVRPGGAVNTRLEAVNAASLFSSGTWHKSDMSITNRPLAFSRSGKDLLRVFRKQVLLDRSNVAPRLFMVLIESKKGVPFGTTSMRSQIRCFPYMRGICNCLKL